jgi:hypothetical protein
MLEKIKQFFIRVLDYFEEAQMARVKEAMRNSPWSRIE